MGSDGKLTGMSNRPRDDLSSGRITEDDDVFALTHLFGLLWRWLWLILLVAILLSGTVVGFSLEQTPTYQASIMILVGQERGLGATPQDSGALQDMTPTMAEAIQSRPVAESVIERLDLQVSPEYVLQNLSAEPVPETVFITVNYSDPNAKTAQRVAEAVGVAFSDRVEEATPKDSNITATIWEHAQTPGGPSSPNPVRNGVWALLLGLMLGVGLAFLLEYLDDRWRSPEEAETMIGVPTLGVIPEVRASKENLNERKD